MMIFQHYFALQFTMLKRHLTGFGLHPWLSIVVATAAFYTLSFYLFTRTVYAGYAYMLLALSLAFKHSEARRNDFLKLTFSKVHYFTTRLLENSLTVLPFLLFLCFKKEPGMALVLIMFSSAMIFINTKRSFSFTLSTPFYQKPFEFIVGFRTWAGVFLLAYFLTAMSLIYQNFNLGIFSLMGIFGLCLTFYTEPENEYFVWIHKLKAGAFLLDKIKTAVVFSSLLSLPVTLSLLIFFRAHIASIVIFQLLGYCYLAMMILAKYTSYPEKINLPQAILFATALVVPPLFLALIPFFYFQSVKRLKVILG